MFSVDEYLNEFRRVHNNPMFQHDASFAELITKFILKRNMSFREVYSSSFYPQYVRLGEQHLFIWDNYYWDLFGAYCQCNILMQYDKNYTDFCKIYFSGLLYLFLSLRLEKYPYLSLAIAEAYPIWRSAFQSTYSNDPRLKNAMVQIKEQSKKRFLPAKLFVFFHEYCHCIYTDLTLFKRDKIQIVTFCNSLLSYPKRPIIDEHTDLAIHMLARSEDKRAIEEVCCDLRAIQKTTSFWNKYFDQKTPVDITHQAVLSHAGCVQAFQHIIMQVESVYNWFYISTQNTPLWERKKVWYSFEPEIRKRDIEIISARFQFMHLASPLFPEFILDKSKEHIKGIMIANPFDTDEYNDFFNSIVECMCSYENMESTLLRAMELEEHHSQREASMKRDQIIGWAM